MTCYSTEPKTRKYVKGYGFFSFARNLSKAAFTLTYILTIYILLVNKIKCKCPHLYMNI